MLELILELDFNIKVTIVQLALDGLTTAGSHNKNVYLRAIIDELAPNTIINKNIIIED